MVLLADTLFSRKCKTIVVLYQINTISVLLSDTLFAKVIPKWYYFYIYCLRKYTIVSENNTKRYYFKVIPCWQCFKVIPKWYHFQIYCFRKSVDQSWYCFKVIPFWYYFQIHCSQRQARMIEATIACMKTSRLFIVPVYC